MSHISPAAALHFFCFLDFFGFLAGRDSLASRSFSIWSIRLAVPPSAFSKALIRAAKAVSSSGVCSGGDGEPPPKAVDEVRFKEADRAERASRSEDNGLRHLVGQQYDGKSREYQAQLPRAGRSAAASRDLGYVGVFVGV